MSGWFGWQCVEGLWPKAARVTSLLVGLVVWLASPMLARSQPLGHAEDAKVRIGFSNLVARLDNDEIGIAKAEFRVHILEALRAAGFNAVGAESLVFERDEGERADLVLGGTVRELHCRKLRWRTNCRIGITWELLDREHDAVVYRVMARHMEEGIDRGNNALTGRKLILGALRVLTGRARFAELLGRRRDVLVEDAQYPGAGFRICRPAAERQLPAQFNEAADATFLVKQAGGFGSGFSISPDGLMLTAAHVVSGKTVQVTSRGNTSSRTGTVLRVSRKQDVALVQLPSTGSDQPCLEIEATAPAAGSDVYAIGSPASQDLAFSLTRGIVSGLRLVDGVQLIQTDASLNPGNSGGPLLDIRARVVGVVTRKIAGRALEGLGFGTQIQDALQALGLQPELVTSASLLKPAARASAAAAKGPVDDVESPVPSLDPHGDKLRADQADYQRRIREQDAATPWFVAPLRWGGLVACIGGGLGIAYTTAASNDESISHTNFVEYRTQNDVSWAVFLLGTGAFAISYPLQAPLPPARLQSAQRPWSIQLGPGHLNLAVALDQ